ncbi:hypothetical protein B0H16DRAFT_1357669 [Mycena metata]|uniref:Uncharacterized protein n=1 Tax=Mycena metata TaxID=1033252 RepID=A0AAD7KD30_9AGAR|nr:hypothetical protein B0H16DRAFT_1357669 [Mycena metata]
MSFHPGSSLYYNHEQYKPPIPADSDSESDLTELSDVEDAMTADLIRAACDTQDLLPLYLAGQDPDAADNPVKDLDALHPRHRLQAYGPRNPRRSARFQHPMEDSALGSKRRRTPSPIRSVRKKVPKQSSEDKKWFTPDGALRIPSHEWQTIPKPYSQLADSDNSSTVTNQSTTKKNRRSKKSKQGHRGGKLDKPKDGSVNPRREIAMARKALDKGDFITSSTFSLLEDASISGQNLQGKRPPPLVRKQIRELYFEKPDAAALDPWLAHFHPLPYVMPNGSDDPVRERDTFVVDKHGLIFFYRTTRAMWLHKRIDEIQAAQEILVGDDLTDPDIQAKFAEQDRGPHMAIIFGHQRQSSEKPYLAAWGRENQDRADQFMALPIVQDIIRWVCKKVRQVWPGLAARFEADARWHKEKYGIEPMFGLFWNFCWNAAFPDQLGIHAGPHVDWKNQLGICLILTYILKCGLLFNHKLKTWLVLWEGDLVAELPPWTLTGYPSSLFYHFNVNVDRLQVVWTSNNIERATPENSQPVVTGDATGRGSMVFFNQSTMRVGPMIGHHSLKSAAKAHKVIKVDRSGSLQEAFDRSSYQIPLPSHVVEKFSTNAPKPSDFTDL